MMNLAEYRRPTTRLADFLPWAALVDEGVATMEDTDRGAKIGLRWAQGPFEIMNELGIEHSFLVCQLSDPSQKHNGC